MKERIMRLWLVGLAGLLIPAIAGAQTPPRPIVGELFTSEGCSSCPPADAEIAALARSRPDLLLFTFHVTYWNDLGWHDPYSLDAATALQQAYVSLGVSPELYTPALVVDGKIDAIGSDEDAVSAAFRQAAETQTTAARISLRHLGTGIDVALSSGDGAGKVILIGYDPSHRTPVSAGENDGRTLLEANIVRSISVIGVWSGLPLHLTVAAPRGQEVAVLLQREDGAIVGASRPLIVDGGG
jgi:hypothetical protein